MAQYFSQKYGAQNEAFDGEGGGLREKALNVRELGVMGRIG